MDLLNVWAQTLKSGGGRGEVMGVLLVRSGGVVLVRSQPQLLWPTYPCHSSRGCGGGLDELYVWVSSKLSGEKRGRAVMQFIVERSGEVSNIKTLNSTNDKLAAEVTKIIDSSPKWVAGEDKGELERVSIILRFVL